MSDRLPITNPGLEEIPKELSGVDLFVMTYRVNGVRLEKGEDLNILKTTFAKELDEKTDSIGIRVRQVILRIFSSKKGTTIVFITSKKQNPHELCTGYLKRILTNSHFLNLHKFNPNNLEIYGERFYYIGPGYDGKSKETALKTAISLLSTPGAIPSNVVVNLPTGMANVHLEKRTNQFKVEVRFRDADISNAREFMQKLGFA
jgi:hypothetical protein